MRGIALDGISKAFGPTHVLHNVSLRLGEGEFVSLVGPSGCGKTTLLRIIAGLEPADSGTVQIDGRDVTRLRAADRDIAMVFQNYALYPHLTVRENLAIPLVMRDLTGLQRLPLVGGLMPGSRVRQAEIGRRVMAAAEMLRIGHLLARKPGQLSGGQRQRVALGRALVRQPRAFLMDEPLSNLDAELRASTRREIVELHRAAGVTTVFVTHDQVEAMTMSDRVAVMMEGRVLQVGSPRDVYARPASLAVAAFLGSPRINTVTVAAAGGRLLLAGQPLPLAAPAGPAGVWTLGLRPESLRPAAAGIAVDVEHLEFLGAEVLVHARLPAASGLIVRLTAAEAAGLAVGTRLHLTADWSAALLFDAAGQRIDIPALTPAHA
jgi:multiple sugar transport system ATP-binding protein